MREPILLQYDGLWLRDMAADLLGRGPAGHLLSALVLLLQEVQAVKVARPEHLMADDEGNNPCLHGSA